MGVGVDARDRDRIGHPVIFELDLAPISGIEVILAGEGGSASAREGHLQLPRAWERAANDPSTDEGVRDRGGVAVLVPDRAFISARRSLLHLGDPVADRREEVGAGAADRHLRVAAVDVEHHLLALVERDGVDILVIDLLGRRRAADGSGQRPRGRDRDRRDRQIDPARIGVEPAGREEGQRDQRVRHGDVERLVRRLLIGGHIEEYLNEIVAAVVAFRRTTVSRSFTLASGRGRGRGVGANCHGLPPCCSATGAGYFGSAHKVRGRAFTSLCPQPRGSESRSTSGRRPGWPAPEL